MFYRTIGCLALSILFLSLSGNLSTTESKTQIKTKTAQKKKPARIEGFRSAKFGMKEKDILRAIKKDFKIAKDKVRNFSSSLQQTTGLRIEVPNLLEYGGNAKISYIFGYKSKRLIQVTIFWGVGATKKVDAQDIVDGANLLRDHLNKKKYKKEGFAINAVINEATTIVFRGKDKKNRMALLKLFIPKKGKDKEAKGALEKSSLVLSYILNPNKPDVYTIRDDDF
jgi:hypothetical protein